LLRITAIAADHRKREALMTAVGRGRKPAPRIAFFDIDGTLLPFGERKPSVNTAYALGRLKEKGVILCMATGRSLITMPKLEGIDFDAFMVFNGSYCFDKDTEIFSCPIPRGDVFQILTNARRMNRAIAICNDRYTVANAPDADLDLFFSVGGSTVSVADDFDNRCHDKIYQMLISCGKDEYGEVLHGTTGTALAPWWDRAVDIIPAASGKGIAVDNMIKHYGLSRDEAIAFGDGDNDIGMLRAVGTGIAMGNAPSSVKTAADSVCGSVDEDGIYWYCIEHGLI
jgi:Cof subfamily protein (haloacid dehalogenase superfamily)